MTAHPTEARRRTTVEKLARIFARLRDLDERPPVPADEAEARRAIAGTIQELWGSDEVRAASPTPLDEVHAGLVYFASTLHRVVPELYRELEAAVEECYPGRGDRGAAAADVRLVDGRRPRRQPERDRRGDRGGARHDADRLPAPARVADRAAGAAGVARRPAGGPLGTSSRGALAALAELFPDEAGRGLARNPEEPYRRYFSLVAARVRATRLGEPGGYGAPGELLADLRLAQRLLRDGHGQFVAMTQLHDVIRQVEVFGFHFARLDVREHAARHGEAIAEVLSALGVHEAYGVAGAGRARARCWRARSPSGGR